MDGSHQVLLSGPTRFLKCRQDLTEQVLFYTFIQVWKVSDSAKFRQAVLICSNKHVLVVNISQNIMATLRLILIFILKDWKAAPFTRHCHFKQGIAQQLSF